MRPTAFSRTRAESSVCRRAVLLAGGQGLRAWNPGLRESKLSLPLLGETVLEHQCRWLAEQGIRRLAVALCDDAGEPLRHQQEPTYVEGVELFWCHERLRQGTAGCLRSLLQFMGLEHPDEGAIAAAVGYGAFENMRRLERSGSFEHKMSPGDPGDEESYQVRRGEVGGYLDYLSPDDIAFIERVIDEAGNPFNAGASVAPTA